MIYVMIAVFLLVTYRSNLTNMFDYMMNNLFIIVYFPNIAIYLAAIIATNVILFVSIFSNKTSKVIKNINIIVYTIINYLLVLLLFTVNKSGLDLFSQSSIYQNESATALIELTSILFIIWVVFLVLYKLILSYLSKDDEISEDTARIRKKILMEEQRKIFNEKRELEREKEELRKAQEEMTTPVVVREETPKQMSREEYMMKQFDQMLTLNDYKVLLNVLKEHRDKEKAEQERQQMIKNENVKYEELLSLYR